MPPQLGGYEMSRIKRLEANRILYLYKTLNLNEKKEMFQNLIFADVNIFNYEHGTLKNGSEVGHVCVNGGKIQLTVHKESNVQDEN